MLPAINKGRYFVFCTHQLVKPKYRKHRDNKIHKNTFITSVIKMSENNGNSSVGGNGVASIISKDPIEYLPSPTKSQNDKKEYRVIRLKNKLTALLISDVATETSDNTEDNEIEYSGGEEGSSYESTVYEIGENLDDDNDDESGTRLPMREQKLAALGLCVGVGSYSDPWKIQGMAHFLEHMVFMGSEKFPKENDFDAFIKKRGGSDNAETDCETTTFYFECQNKHLKEAIDKFSQFFISPLMRRGAMTREREAIESEFQMGITSDSNRREQLLSSLAHPDSPVRKFTWGNLKTLRDNVSDNDLYKAVHEFRKRHYSAHRMTLAVQARLPIETLETWIRECFSAVPNNDLPPDDFSKFAGLAFNTSEFSKMFWVKSVHDVYEVELTWVLPPLQHMYRSKPCGYIEELIGHEGKGSILSYLRKKVWALAISAGCEMDGSSCNSMYTLFVIKIILTEEGFSHVCEVVNAVFGYIKMLQNAGPSENFFRELQNIHETKFKFAEEIPPDENVESLATNMHYFSPEDYITGSELFFEYNPEAIKKVLNDLTPDSVNIMVSSKNPSRELDKIEPWFKTEYAVSDIPNDWCESWRSVKPDESFRMPDPNIFLTTNFDILPITEEDEKVLYPVKVHHNEQSEVWYRRDVIFNLPQTYVYFYLISPDSLSSSKSVAAMDLYVQILRQMIIEDLYPALVADLRCSINTIDRGIILKFYGYNEKLHLLLETVVSCMSRFNSYLTPELFEAVKQVQTRYYYNTFLKPEKLSKDLRLSLLLQTYWNTVDKHAALADISLSTMREFAGDFVKHLYVKSLFQGNLTKTEAISDCNKVIEILKIGPLLPDSHPEIKVLELPLGEYCCRVQSFNPTDTNSIVTNYYQSGPFDITSYCIVELIMMLMEEPVFDVLRTKEQLGYHIYSTLRYTFGIVGFSITVNCQAVKHSVDHVDNRIETFLQKFSKILKKTNEKDLAEVRSALIKLKTLSDIHLKEEVSRNWEEITSSEYVFDRKKKEVACLEGINMPEIRQWFVNHVQHGSKHNFRKLSVQVVGTVQTEKQGKSSVVNCKIRKRSKERQHQPQSEMECNNQVPDPSAGYPLQFITGEENKKKHPSKFISDIGGFKTGLTVYPTNRIKY